MGFGSFFAGLAADAAREYANRRGLEGMIEDAGNLKNKVSGFFSSNNDDGDYEEYSQDGSGNFWDILDGYIEEDDFDGAQSFINDYVGPGNKDDFFYYAMAYVYNIKAVTNDSIEDERKAKNYISNAVNQLNGDTEWRNSVYELKRKIDDNLRLFKKENEEAKQFQKEWEELTKCFDLDNPCPASDAVTALETFFDTYNIERDIMYHYYLYRAYEKLILVEEDPLDAWYDSMKEEVAIVTALGRNNPQENDSFVATIQESFNFWENKKRENEIEVGSNQSQGNHISTDEEAYLEELRACYEDGVITDKERRILNRLRTSLGISESRAAELEAMCQTPALTQDEQAYADEVKACLEDDGIITAKERRLLDRLAKSLNISPQRASDIEQMMQ